MNPRAGWWNTYHARRAAWSTHRVHHRGEIAMAVLFCLVVAHAIWWAVLIGAIPGDALITGIDVFLAVAAVTALVVQVVAYRRCAHPLDSVGGATCPQCGTHIRARLDPAPTDRIPPTGDGDESEWRAGFNDGLDLAGCLDADDVEAAIRNTTEYLRNCSARREFVSGRLAAFCAFARILAEPSTDQEQPGQDCDD